MRLKELSELERERGTERLATLEEMMNAAAPDDDDDIRGRSTSSRGDGNKKINKSNSNNKKGGIRAFKLVGGLGKAPLAIKTTTDKQIQEDGPINPYRTYAEQSHVINAGVPSGTGLMLWRPRDRVSKTGRYRSGVVKGLPLNSSNSKEYLESKRNKPYISSV